MIRVERGISKWVGAADYSGLGHGHAPGGAQDRFSFRLANQLIGNVPGATALEFALAPAVMVVEKTCRVVVGGAPVEIEIDGQSAPEWTVLEVPSGAQVSVRMGAFGCRFYLAVAADSEAAVVGRTRVEGTEDWAPDPGTVRVLAGPESDPAALEALCGRPWQVGLQSSGMGLVLEGEPLDLPGYDLLSAPVQDGTIQATANGLLALLRERGTLGGYPRVATVIDCDVDRLAQFRPGETLRFQLVDRDDARGFCELQERALDAALG